MLQEVDQEAMEEVLGVQLDKEDEDDEDEQEGMRYAMILGAYTCQASAYMVAKLKFIAATSYSCLCLQHSMSMMHITLVNRQPGG